MQTTSLPAAQSAALSLAGTHLQYGGTMAPRRMALEVARSAFVVLAGHDVAGPAPRQGSIEAAVADCRLLPDE